MSDEPNIDECVLVDEFAFDGTTGGDDGYYLELYRTADGRHFTNIASSGQNSIVDGAIGFHGWVDDETLSSWSAI
ncbi:MAG: hypothetical protein AAGM21_10180 [Pseudomonadota bacterium]